MWTVTKKQMSSGVALLAALTCVPGWAGNTIVGVTQPAVDKVNKVQPLQCSQNDYLNNQAGYQGCLQCKSAVENWKKKIPEEAKKRGAADTGVMAGNTLATSGAANAMSANGKQASAQDHAGTAANSGKGSMAQRQALGNEMSGVFGECEQDLESKCTTIAGESDRNQASDMRSACANGKKASKKFADSQKEGGQGMGDLSKMMEAASQAMQMMQKKPEESGITENPAAPATPEAPEIQTSNIGDKAGSAPLVGFGASSGNSVEAPETGSAAGGSGLTGGSSFRPEPTGSSDMGAPVAAATTGVSGGGGSGASKSHDGSGSSRAGDAVAAAGEGNKDIGFEINSGGGMRMVGLKPSRGELEAVGEIAPSDAVGALGGEVGDRGPASEDTAGANDAMMQDGESIFVRVRDKYSVLKGAGRI